MSKQKIDSIMTQARIARQQTRAADQSSGTYVDLAGGPLDAAVDRVVTDETARRWAKVGALQTSNRNKLEAIEDRQVKATAKRTKVDSRRITVLVTINPKRGASAERFELYRDGMTVDEYVTAGGRRADVAWDQQRGFIAAV